MRLLNVQLTELAFEESTEILNELPVLSKRNLKVILTMEGFVVVVVVVVLQGGGRW